MSLDLPPFRPRFPWWSGDLQTIANVVRPPARDLSPHTSSRILVDLDDGSGDRLVCTLDLPAQAKPSALTILIHGLTGTQESSYIHSMARRLLDAGAPVLRVNLRGAGPSRAFCGGQYYAGRSQDFRALIERLPPETTSQGLRAVGYSLGGAMLLKYLGEEGNSSPLVAAATVCAPIDLSETCRNMLRPRNTIYHRHILRLMKVEATAPGAILTPEERSAILSSRSVWQYDEEFIAPRHGFAGAEDYYARCRPLGFMGDIRVPTLVLAALEDPWIPGRLYTGYDWAANPALRPLLSQQGGHVGFHGSGSSSPWSDLVISRFFDHG